jgi:hypothetical protein
LNSPTGPSQKVVVVELSAPHSRAVSNFPQIKEDQPRCRAVPLFPQMHYMRAQLLVVTGT